MKGYKQYKVNSKKIESIIINIRGQITINKANGDALVFANKYDLRMLQTSAPRLYKEVIEIIEG